MNNMGFKIVDTLHVIVVGAKDPSPADWQEYIGAIRAEERKGIDVTRMRTLVFSDGGGPNAGQRKAASDLLNGRATPIAIVTGVAIMRGIITALRWFNPEVRAYAPTEVREALDYLKVPAQNFESLKTMARDLQVTLRLEECKALEQARL
jgi:hypothetical protein